MSSTTSSLSSSVRSGDGLKVDKKKIRALKGLKQIVVKRRPLSERVDAEGDKPAVAAEALTRKRPAPGHEYEAGADDGTGGVLPSQRDWYGQEQRRRKTEYERSRDETTGNAPGSARRSLSVVCLSCRRTGHYASECPENVGSARHQGTESQGNQCFNCGKYGHALRNCPKPRNGQELPFATCFVCKQQGHIASQCEQNARGVYPKGGSCIKCGSVRHLVKDCPGRSRLETQPAGSHVFFDEAEEREATERVSGNFD